MVFVLGALPALPAQNATAPGQPTVPELIEQLKQREAAAKSVSLAMRSRTAVPDGPVFEATGSLRVLGSTHFHVAMRMKVGDGMEGEHEVVRTPNGTWTREVDPMNGEVVTRMSKETMAALEEASKVLGDEVPVGAIPGQSEAPLGSAMLASLAKRFDLQVANKLVRDGIDHWVIRGEVREGLAADPEDDGLPKPDRVEVLVRTGAQGPLAVVKMTQYADGAEVLSVEVDEVVLDQPMEERSFRIDERGKRVLDVMDYPPAARQIQDLLDRAARKKAEAKGKDGEGKEGRDGKTPGEAPRDRDR